MRADRFCLPTLLSEKNSSILALIELVLQSSYALVKSIVRVLKFFNKKCEILIDLLLLRVPNVPLSAPFTEAIHVRFIHSYRLL